MTDENTSFDPSFLAEVEVDKDDVWKGDALGRKAFAKPLTDLVSNARNAPFCIAVDGEWGSGKTFFLKRWCAEFSKQGKAIYFNAWEDDFHADPLIAIIGQLWGAIENGVLNEICDSVKENWRTLAANAVLRCSGSGFTSSDFQTASGKTVEEYLEARRSIDTLQKRLRELANATREKTEKPLVFIVDELDRCRPTFAIELLERVKHVVGVPGIVFVFGINQKGLEKSIQSVYGKIDARDYLRRFFDVGMTLPQARVSNYCQYLINKHKIQDAIAESNIHRRQATGVSADWSGFVEKMPTMVSLLGLSLRQIEQAIRMLLVILHNKEVANEPRTRQFEEHLGVFILLRIKDRDLYEKFTNENYSVKATMDDMLHFLPKAEDGDYPADGLVIIIVRAFYLCYDVEEYDDIIQELRASRNSKELTQERFIPKIIVEMKNENIRQQLAGWVEHVSNIRRWGDDGHHMPLQKRIASFLEWGDNWQS